MSIPKPKKWNHAGCILGDGYSIAWRLYDAQFWGVPQRRKRIYLIADFRGERAGEILFKPESLRRNTEKGAAPWENPAGNVTGSAGRSGQVFCLQGNGIDRADTAGCNGCGWNGGGIAYTLNTIDRQAVVCFAWANSGQAGLSADETAPTIKSARNGEPGVAYSIDCRNLVLNEEKSGTLQAKNQGGYSLNYQNPVFCLNDQGGGADGRE